MARTRTVTQQYARLIRPHPPLEPCEERAQEIGPLLDSLAGRVLCLQARHRPGCSADLEHLVITKAAVWAISTQRINRRACFAATGSPGPHEGLTIGGTDRTDLLRRVDEQVALVRTALLEANAHEVPVRGALCLVEGTPALRQAALQVRGHLVTWPTDLCARLLEDGPFDEEDRAALHRLFARSFAPAQHRPLH